jgi:hypothetical protein
MCIITGLKSLPVSLAMSVAFAGLSSISMVSSISRLLSGKLIVNFTPLKYYYTIELFKPSVLDGELEW